MQDYTSPRVSLHAAQSQRLAAISERDASHRALQQLRRTLEDERLTSDYLRHELQRTREQLDEAKAALTAHGFKLHADGVWR